jgi:hypothetical protein
MTGLEIFDIFSYLCTELPGVVRAIFGVSFQCSG